MTGVQTCALPIWIHVRAVVILDEDDSDDDMMRFKNNEKLSWSSLISLVHVLP